MSKYTRLEEHARMLYESLLAQKTRAEDLNNVLTLRRQTASFLTSDPTYAALLVKRVTELLQGIDTPAHGDLNSE